MRLRRCRTHRGAGARATAQALAAFALIALVAALRPLWAQTVPTGVQSYHVLGYEEHLWAMYARTPSGGLQQNSMRSVVTISASSDNQVFRYDHWEDGFEADVFTPTQSLTLVLGDGNSGFQDAFETVSYANDDGTESWIGPWAETDAAGVGPGAGDVQISGGQLTITNSVGPTSIQRTADVTGAGLTFAHLSFDVSTTGAVAGDQIVVEFSNGGPFTVLETFDGAVSGFRM